jgi:small conductance mechanosensitive channel
MEMLQNWFAENQTLMIDWAIKIVIALAIFFIGKAVASWLSKAVEKLLLHRKIDKTVASFLVSILHGIMLTFVVIAAISHLGFNTTSLVAVLGAAGLAVGLALQGSLSNFASGVLLVSFRPFKAGDFVEVAGISGTVEEVLIFSTKLKTPDNKQIIIPNGAITGGAITNYSAKETRRVDLTIGVSYDADLAQTKEILTRITDSHELILKDPGVQIAVAELADSSVNFVVRSWAKTADYWTVYFDLLETIKLELDKAGIEIPYPQMSVHLNKENSNES